MGLIFKEVIRVCSDLSDILLRTLNGESENKVLEAVRDFKNEFKEMDLVKRYAQEGKQFNLLYRSIQ